MIGAMRHNIGHVINRKNVAHVLQRQGETVAGNVNEITNAMSFLISTTHVWHKSLNLGSALSLGSYALAAAGQNNKKIALAAIIAQPFAWRAMASFGASKTLPKPAKKEFLLRAIKAHPVTASMTAAIAAITTGYMVQDKKMDKDLNQKKEGCV